MPKAEWGIKRICMACSAKFYDLHRDPVDCPKCGSRFDPELAIRGKRGRTSGIVAKEEEVGKPAAEAQPEITEDIDDIETIADLEDIDDLETDDVADDAIMENTDDLAGGDDLPPMGERSSRPDDDEG